ncbi:MAG: 30S ribosomal protein S3 [Anaerolineales bacterium]|nr:30S ribosomal protein S3 [Anaerolineales bacterium]MCB9127201.1 30S ribosomal protein S3 [Ardenticatenales bacterium]MCB9171957.1 30S ribosomal protein S3 [Ardenticatenales bacterium]
MGRKVHPYGFRLGIIKDWKAKWYADGERYADLLQEDLKIRKHISTELGRAGISELQIERFPNQVQLTISTAKPGIVIGRKGSNVKQLREDLEAMTGKKFKIDIQEVDNPDINAQLIAESIAQQLERRVAHRRAMRQAIQRATRAGAKGIRITVSGRLGGSDMARREDAQEGRVPRHTLRADIDYATAEAVTTYSTIGVKVWVYKDDVLDIDTAM